MDNQIKNHRTTIIRLTYLIGKGSLVETKKYLKNVYTLSEWVTTTISTTISYLNTYNTSSAYTPEQYAEALVEQYSRQLQDLYKSGARMFGVFAAGDSGCTRGMMAEFSMNSCVDEVNSAVMLFNSRLNATLNDLNDRFDDAKFILIEGSREYPNDINVTHTPCCGGSSTSGKGQCAPNQVPCSNSQKLLFLGCISSNGED